MKKNILVIDDEKYIVLILKELLTAEGYNVITAENGKAGLDKLSSSPTPDLVIVDYNMPCANGKQVIETMRKHIQHINTPVILSTGSDCLFSDFPDKKDYQIMIQKPFDLEEMVEAVEKLIG